MTVRFEGDCLTSVMELKTGVRRYFANWIEDSVKWGA